LNKVAYLSQRSPTTIFLRETNNAARKRFRVTGKGDLKCYPTRLRGKSQRFLVTKLTAGRLHVPELLPNATPLQSRPKIRIISKRTNEKKTNRTITEE